jgi:cytochrome c
MRLTIATLAFAAAVAPVMAFAAGNAVDGQRDFARCARCHAVQPGTNGIGPSLSGVVGRQSGSEPGFHYSTAMQNAHLTWDPTSLNAFLTNPQHDVHGTKMFASVTDAQQRQDIIAYLQTLK